MTQTAASLSLALAAAHALPDQDGAPDWVHLLPAVQREITTFDGRGPYRVVDADAVIAASLDDPRGLPIDENHATDLAAPKGGPAPARGWITELQSREDGIWGRVEWTGTGRDLVAGRAYRGISPVFFHDGKGVIRKIARASLVNTPNLRGLTALHQENPMTFMERMAELLGLQRDASEDQIAAAVEATAAKAPQLQSSLTAIGAALGVAESAEPQVIIDAARAARSGGTSVAALQAELVSITGELNTIREAGARAAATSFVDGAIRAGRVGVKPLRDHYIAMHMQDPARVEKEVGAMPVLGPSGTIANPPAAANGEIALNSDQLAAARALGVDPADYAKTLAAERGKEEIA